MQEMQETQVWSLSQDDPPGGGHGNSLKYSCLQNPMDRGTWKVTVHKGLQTVGHDWSDLAQYEILFYDS